MLLFFPRAVKFSAKLMARALATRTKCTIMYATETGKSETFAQQLREIFMHAFDVRVTTSITTSITTMYDYNL